jgi:drug/metabolite transporter (DMT)-like permease
MRTSTAHVRGVALLAGASLCWSLGGILIRLLDASDWTIVFWRSVFMALTLLAVLALWTRGRLLDAFRAAGWKGALSGAFMACAFICFILSITRTTVANTLVLMASAPFFSAIVGRVLLGERLAPRAWLAMAAAVAGIALMFAGELGPGELVGNLLALAVALAFAGNIVVLKRAGGANMVPAVILGGLFSAIVALPLAEPLAVAPHEFGVLLALGAVQLGLGLTFYVFGARHLPAAEVSLMGLLETVLSPLWVWLFIAERPSDTALIGGALVVLSLAALALAGGRGTRSPVGLA